MLISVFFVQETYLFRAACAELKTDIQNNRKAEADKWRSQRAQLQHEVEILGQKMTQDSMGLKDELKGMFDDRNMLVRMEHKEMERMVNSSPPHHYALQCLLSEHLWCCRCPVANMLQIQELNYKITVALNSDSRGDVEGVRWLLTRRAALALAIVIIMVLGSLNFMRFTPTPEKTKHVKETKETYEDFGDLPDDESKRISSPSTLRDEVPVPEALSTG
jgi:hypothetical protein